LEYHALEYHALEYTDAQEGNGSRMSDVEGLQSVQKHGNEEQHAHDDAFAQEPRNDADTQHDADKNPRVNDAVDAAVDGSEDGFENSGEQDGHGSDNTKKGSGASVPAGATRFSSWTYAVLFLLFSIVGVGMMQWGVSVSTTGSALPEPLAGLWDFIVKMWTQQRYVFVLNLALLALVYLAVLFLINRFWVATPVVMTAWMIFSLVERFKVQSRYEALLPTDFDFLNSNAGDIATFLPSGSTGIIINVTIGMLVFIALCVLANHFDLRKGKIIEHRGSGKAGAAARIVGVLVPGLVVAMFVSAVGTVGSWANSLAERMGDIPSMWDSVYDSQRNGTLLAFSRQLNPKIMDEPAGYSEATMQGVLKRYEAQAKTINATRTANLTDSSVVFVLSESFSDPLRVPGLNLNEDPMPFIRSLKDTTTSGLMLSSGYGGGTANLEFQALTGLSMANFDSSLTSPYQQLIPKLQWTPSVNQLWDGGKDSVAFHPYEASMYSRSTNYQKFGFPHFYTRSGPEFIKNSKPIDTSPYAGDNAAYSDVTDWMQNAPGNRFVQLVTMQNHMPYSNWYNNNQFVATPGQGAPALGSDETMAIQTYAKGMSLTDASTSDFLSSLDSENRPITVMFYGDHLPYIAFLTLLHGKISAMEPPVVNKIQGWSRIPAGQTIYLDAQGNPMDARSFDAPTKQMLNDYKLIQYDITAGKHYLENTDFMTLPGVKNAAAIAGSNGKQGDAKSSASNTAASASVPSAASALTSLDIVNGSATAAAHQREGQVARSGR
jgi:phosphoglycerol transferase MdoB-like AlkP superfamily enzyme